MPLLRSTRATPRLLTCAGKNSGRQKLGVSKQRSGRRGQAARHSPVKRCCCVRAQILDKGAHLTPSYLVELGISRFARPQSFTAEFVSSLKLLHVVERGVLDGLLQKRGTGEGLRPQDGKKDGRSLPGNKGICSDSVSPPGSTPTVLAFPVRRAIQTVTPVGMWEWNRWNGNPQERAEFFPTVAPGDIHDQKTMRRNGCLYGRIVLPVLLLV